MPTQYSELLLLIKQLFHCFLFLFTGSGLLKFSVAIPILTFGISACIFFNRKLINFMFLNSSIGLLLYNFLWTIRLGKEGVLTKVHEAASGVSGSVSSEVVKEVQAVVSNSGVTASSQLVLFDGLAIFFILIVTTIIPVCFLLARNVRFSRELQFLLSWIELSLLFIFSTANMFIFYFFYECTIIPILLLILIWGSNVRRQKAAIYFMFYSALSGVLFFIACLYINFFFGSLNISYINSVLHILYTEEESSALGARLNSEVYQIIFWLLFCSFAIKVPTIPFMLWLPEAHVEASTIGSVLLAALILKIGGYGIVRFAIPFYHFSTGLPGNSMVCNLFCFSALAAAVCACAQADLKRIVAYSSIVHINLYIVTLFPIYHSKEHYDVYDTVNIELQEGGLVGMFSHALISSGIFILVGILYSRYSSRLVFQFQGLCTVMPRYATIYFLFILSNLAFPLTSGFLPELYVFIYIFISLKYFNLLIVVITLLISTFFNLIVIQKILFGYVGTFTFIQKFKDLQIAENKILCYLFFFNIIMGCLPIYYFNLLKDIEYIHTTMSIRNEITDNRPGPTTAKKVLERRKQPDPVIEYEENLFNFIDVKGKLESIDVPLATFILRNQLYGDYYSKPHIDLEGPLFKYLSPERQQEITNEKIAQAEREIDIQKAKDLYAFDPLFPKFIQFTCAFSAEELLQLYELICKIDLICKLSGHSIKEFDDWYEFQQAFNEIKIALKIDEKFFAADYQAPENEKWC